MQRILVSLFLLFPIFIFAKDVPNLKTRVTDETWTLHSDFVSALEKQLKDHEKKTSNQIAVYLFSSLEGENLEEYSIRVAEEWKLGQKGKDNGVLLLIAMEDRKLRIEVGYGLEGVLTDVLCHHIIENEIKPAFKKGEFDIGIQNGIKAIMGAIEGEYQMPEPKDYSHLGPLSFLGELSGASDELPIGLKIFLTFFIVFVLGIFTYFAANAPYIGWFLYFFLFPFWSLFPTAIHGANVGASVFLIYAIGVGLYKLYHLLTPHGRKRMKQSSFSSSSSGSRSSGWSSGGSSGGFRGGGGSFGGGGSSGSW
ncbi:PF04536 family protein [Leptospira yanagawae serovar Saopaulo str. Sao Paulo = ATCC 700523]|uniref:PF04536 family protein n=1 Tax=Leptospira yanagawae serovar Saopaulo str. Sao Paulo = ATCC 700523 TaxID=1249483 RepID=A0A5E8HHK0_9LEPT|nr:TPM domain-containing protein [Leptospira yanagawae]EOQ90173.1 PF04536 family protein [Leptospira yanagawae serovar Saopaulo str. Sao Paulo = ATCC 700523]